MRSPELRRGFTLVEFIVGIVMLAVALTSILGLLINQVPQAVDPVQQVRAAQLAQRILNEVLQKSFDEHSDHNGGHFRCGEKVDGVLIPDCSTNYGPDGKGEQAPYAYNDVDDFDTSDNWVDAKLFTQTSVGVSDDEYRNFQIKIAVSGVDFSDGTFRLCGVPCSVGKRIELTVRLPDGSEVDFALYRGNY